jgi:hypothetical protein
MRTAFRWGAGALCVVSLIVCLRDAALHMAKRDAYRRDISVIEKRIKTIENSLVALKDYAPEDPVGVQEAYNHWMDEVSEVVAGYGMSLRVETKEDVQGFGEGLEFLGLKLTVSGVDRRGALISLLTFASTWPQEGTCRIKGFVHEGDRVVFDVVIIGTPSPQRGRGIS